MITLEISIRLYELIVTSNQLKLIASLNNMSNKELHYPMEPLLMQVIVLEVHLIQFKLIENMAQRKSLEFRPSFSNIFLPKLHLTLESVPSEAAIVVTQNRYDLHRNILHSSVPMAECVHPRGLRCVD